MSSARWPMPPRGRVALTTTAGFRRWLLYGTLSRLERAGEVEPRAAHGGIKGRPLRMLLVPDDEEPDEGAHGEPRTTCVHMGKLGKNCVPLRAWHRPMCRIALPS